MVIQTQTKAIPEMKYAQSFPAFLIALIDRPGLTQTISTSIRALKKIFKRYKKPSGLGLSDFYDEQT